jgi:hypothetical protein
VSFAGGEAREEERQGWYAEEEGWFKDESRLPEARPLCCDNSRREHATDSVSDSYSWAGRVDACDVRGC